MTTERGPWSPPVRRPRKRPSGTRGRRPLPNCPSGLASTPHYAREWLEQQAVRSASGPTRPGSPACGCCPPAMSSGASTSGEPSGPRAGPRTRGHRRCPGRSGAGTPPDRPARVSTVPAAPVDNLVNGAAGAGPGRPARPVVGRRPAEGDRADEPPALGHAQVAEQRLGAVEHPEPPGAHAFVGGGQQHQHHRHGRVHVPVGDGPALLGVHAQPGLVGCAVAVEAGLLVGEDEHDRRRLGGAVGPVEPRVGGGPPEAPDRVAALEDQQVEALAEPGRRGPGGAVEDPVQHLGREGAGVEAAHHAPTPHDLAELHGYWVAAAASSLTRDSRAGSPETSSGSVVARPQRNSSRSEAPPAAAASPWAWPRPTSTPAGSSRSCHSPSVSVACRCSDSPRPPTGSPSEWGARNTSSSSLTPSAASSGGTGRGSPWALSASTRCTAVSWAMRRRQKATAWSGWWKVHTRASGSASSSTVSSSASPCWYQPRSSARAGADGGHGRGGSARRPRTISSLCRCTIPVCRTRSVTVHPWQAGTGGSSPSRAAAASAVPSARRA